MEIYRKINKVINMGFIILFAVMAIIALVALCVGYTQHVFTLIVSIVMVALFVSDNKNEHS